MTLTKPLHTYRSGLIMLAPDLLEARRTWGQRCSAFYHRAAISSYAWLGLHCITTSPPTLPDRKCAMHSTFPVRCPTGQQLTNVHTCMTCRGSHLPVCRPLRAHGADGEGTHAGTGPHEGGGPHGAGVRGGRQDVVLDDIAEVGHGGGVAFHGLTAAVA